MNLYLPRLITAFLAFIAGVCAVWSWPSEAKKPNLDNAAIAEKPMIAPLVKATPRQNLEPQIEPRPRRIKPIPFDRHENFEDAVLTLKRLANYMGKKGLQTFRVSEVRDDHGTEFTYAYWMQDNSIIILHFPLYGEPSEPELFWLSDKARIDLKDVVPTGDYGNLVFRLVQRDWADKVLASCKAGYELRFVAK
ncbi:MAG: hypothetical protein IPN69_18530 [Acidobacteria bacterium]|nr:hypothetical protein [Acidobacteriota bacterium]